MPPIVRTSGKAGALSPRNERPVPRALNGARRWESEIGVERAFRRSRMKPAAFDYIAPNSLEAAVEAIAAANGDGKILAGGQSLMPLLNFRMARPSVIVDLMHIPDMSFIELRCEKGAICG